MNSSNEFGTNSNLNSKRSFESDSGSFPIKETLFKLAESFNFANSSIVYIHLSEESQQMEQKTLPKRERYRDPAKSFRSRMGDLVDTLYSGERNSKMVCLELAQMEHKFKTLPFKNNKLLIIAVESSLIYCLGQMKNKANEWLKQTEEIGKELLSQQSDYMSVDPHSFARMYNMLGDIQTRLSGQGKNKEYLIQAENSLNQGKEIIEKYLEDPHKSRNLSWYFTNLGTVYSYREEYEKAKGYYLEGLEYRLRLEDVPRLLAMSYELLAALCLKTHELNEAEMYAKEALKYSKIFCKEGWYLEAKIQRHLAMIWYEKGDIQKARVTYKQVFDILEKHLIEGNDLTDIYKKEYQEIFGEPFDL